MRLIDADALKNAFSNMYREDYERWIKEVIDNAPTIAPELIRKVMYRELERLKRMDVHGMQCEKGDYIFEYNEVSDRQGIVQFEKGVFVYHYSITEPMSRQTFEEFCEEVVEKENNRGMDNKQSNKA